jgi:diguanylate cyclase (GGDEF)-like protein
MGPLSTRLTAGVVYVCAFFALTAAVIGTLGVVGVHSANLTGKQIAHDELETSAITAQVGRQIDAVYASGQAMALTPDRAQRSQLITTLNEEQIPHAEAGLAGLQRIHESDGAAEKSDVTRLVTQWEVLRNLVTQAGSSAGTSSDAGLAARLSAADAPLVAHIQALTQREETDASDDQAASAASSTRTMLTIAGAVFLAFLAAIGVGWLSSRRLQRAVEPGQEQVEFADTLQLAEDESEAHNLLQRHLQRLVSGAAVTVLNRNNSADRLEAVTTLPADSPLVQTLAHAEPRSCLAVRSARVHQADDQRPALLGCPVCSQCPGKTTCTPLTVGGEVIGSVLVNRTAHYGPLEQQQIRDSVGQAAPVLANLRNLAIAEVRAATDSLTGLPNKRAVDDTLKRMLAQASRTLAPLSLLMLDLDHFKDINDRFGHPIGDQALANVGAALRSAIRESDFAGRSGGEEFAVMLPATDIAGAMLTAQKIRAAIAEIAFPGLDLSLTASVGIATYPEHALGSERLERLADAALYVAKRSGRDRVEVAGSVPEVAAETTPAARTSAKR